MPQGEVWGNAYEEHKSGWTEQDFNQIPHIYRDLGSTFMVVVAKNQQYLDSLGLRHPLKAIGLRTVTPELLRLSFSQCKQYVLEHLSRA